MDGMECTYHLAGVQVVQRLAHLQTHITHHLLQAVRPSASQLGMFVPQRGVRDELVQADPVTELLLDIHLPLLHPGLSEA